MTGELFPRLQNDEEFQAWLEQSQLNRDWFLSQVPEELRAKLMTYTIEPLEELGEWLCKRYTDLDVIAKDEKDLRLIDGLGRYIGEVFIKIFGGDWTVAFEPPRMAYLGVPGIKEYKKGYSLLPSTIYPRSWVTALVSRRDTKFIQRRFVEHHKAVHGEH